MTLLLAFCGASLLLAAIGVYGLVTQAVTEWLREIAIRLAPGAHPRTVMAMFVRRALAAGVAGLAIGVVLARCSHERSSRGCMAYVRAMTVSAVVLLAVIGCAAWLPAQRATRLNAVHVLRG